MGTCMQTNRPDRQWGTRAERPEEVESHGGSSFPFLLFFALMVDSAQPTEGAVRVPLLEQELNFDIILHRHRIGN